MSKALIPLRRRNGDVVGCAQVERRDFDWLNRWTWRLHRKGYAFRGQRENGRYRTYLMHRVVTAAPDGLDVDHRNGDKLDNRRENLRIATRSQNMQNRRALNRNNSSGFRGVTYHKHRDQWLARGMVDRKEHFLGWFVTREQATVAAEAFRRDCMPFSAEAAA